MCRSRFATPFSTAAIFSWPIAAISTPPCLTTLDVDKLLGTQIGAEARFGDHVVGELERRARRHDRVTAVGDICERPAVNECRIVLERLHKSRSERLLQENGHRALRLQLACANRLLRTRIADDNARESFLQVRKT